MAPTYLRFPAVQDRLGLSRATIQRMVRDGRFPRPYKLSPQCVGFLASEVDSWIDSRMPAGQR